jgi:hypothetical protein
MRGAYRPTTRFLAEQVIMAQLQGSTEYWSQLLSTPCGSTSPSLMAISASTATKTRNHHQAQTRTQRKGSRRALPSGLRGSEAKARNGADDDRRKKMRTGIKEAEEAIGTVRGME